MPELSDQVQEYVIGLAWDCWSLLGVSSWRRGKIKRVRTLEKAWPAAESWGSYAGAFQASLGQPFRD